MQQTVTVIPDIHGCYDLMMSHLEDLYESNTELIFLGDLIDRAPDTNGDRLVVEHVRDMQDNPSKYGLSAVTVLRGNHEQLLLDAIRREDTELWEYNGGDIGFLYWLLESSPETVMWMNDLPYYTIRGDYLFVHAGVRPNVPLDKQHKSDLIWIREDFFDEDHGLPYTVVHGHTIQEADEPVHFHKRIACDLGSFCRNKLGVLTLTIDNDG